MGSLITNRDRNCLSCRIVSGGGLVGVGLYLGYYAKKNQSANGKVILFGLGGGEFLFVINNFEWYN